MIMLLTMRPAWSWLSAADLLPWLPAFALLLPSLSTQQRRSAAALGLPLIFTLISCLLLRPPFHAWSAVPSASALAALGLWRWSGNKQGNPILTFGLLALGSLGSGCVIGFGAFRERGGANWLDLAAAIYSLIHRGATLTGITEVGWRSAAALALYLALLSLCGWLCLRLHTPPTQSYAALLIVAAAIAGVAATVSPAWNRRLPVMVIANARLTEHTPEWTALLAPPQPIRGIELISRAAHATSVPQGTLIARLTLRFTDGSRSELPIRAGIETAEYAFGRPDVQAGLLHQLTDVERVRLVEPIESKPFAGLTYRSLISLPGHRKLASLSARLDTRAVSGHGVELELDGVRCWSAMPTHLLPASPGRLRIAEHLELTARRPTVDVRPPFSLGEGQLRVSSRLANSANWPHGAQIGQIRMIDPTDSPSIRYWAGVDTAEWAVLRSDLLSRLAHMHPPGRQCGGERNGCGYISMRAIPSGKTGSVLVRITLDPRFAAVGGIWSIDSIDFVRGKLSKQLRATR